MYDVKVPWDGWYISSLYMEEMLLGMAIFVVKDNVLNSYGIV